MFNKLVAIEPVGLIKSAENELHNFAKEVVMHNDIPTDAVEICKRIGDADPVQISYTKTIKNDKMFKVTTT